MGQSKSERDGSIKLEGRRGRGSDWEKYTFKWNWGIMVERGVLFGFFSLLFFTIQIIYSFRIFFVILRGSFGDQAVHELYPKLLKRLDDSSDQVRVTVCATLEMFLQSAPNRCYRSVEMVALVIKSTIMLYWWWLRYWYRHWYLQWRCSYSSTYIHILYLSLSINYVSFPPLFCLVLFCLEFYFISSPPL